MRRRHVARIIQVLALDKIAVEQNDLVMLIAYVKGDVSGQDLLAHVHQFSSLMSYQDWLEIDAVKYADNTNSSPSVEKIVAEVEIFIRRKNFEYPHNNWLAADALSLE